MAKRRRFRQHLSAIRASRGGQLFGRIGHGLMPLAESGGVGAVYGVIEDAANLDFIKNNWYGGPVGAGGLALLLHRKRPTSAHALAGAAGYEARFNYMLRKFQLGETNKSPVRWFGKPAGAAPAAQVPATTQELEDYDTGTPQAQAQREFSPLAPLPQFDALEQEQAEASGLDDGDGSSGEGDISSALALHDRSLRTGMY